MRLSHSSARACGCAPHGCQHHHHHHSGASQTTSCLYGQTDDWRVVSAQHLAQLAGGGCVVALAVCCAAQHATPRTTKRRGPMRCRYDKRDAGRVSYNVVQLCSGDLVAHVRRVPVSSTPCVVVQCFVGAPFPGAPSRQLDTKSQACT